MTEQQNPEKLNGGTEKDNGPLDALLKGEQIGTEALIILTLQQQFAEKARERNENEDFDDDGCIGDLDTDESAGRLEKLRGLEECFDGRTTTSFNGAAYADDGTAVRAMTVFPHSSRAGRPYLSA